MPASPLVIAHRGASAAAVDNSLGAFERAIEGGADMIEFDVRRTGDGELIAFHDTRVAGRRVTTLTRAQIEAAVGHRPPRLEEVLELTAGRIGLDVEIKEDGDVARILDAVTAWGDPGDLIVTSFLDSVVAQVKRRAPEVRVGLLLGVARPRPYTRTRWSELFPVARARRCGADLIAPHGRLAALGATDRAAAAGLPSLVWTINEDPALRRFLADPRVAGVITDVPDRARALRDGAAVSATSSR
jgi:glycerophosphoryl diester phosphodiesterase